MKWINTGDGRAVKILRQTELNRETDYRLCNYSFLFLENNANIVWQTLTGQRALLTEEEWAALLQFQTGPQDYAFVEENGLAELALCRILVEKDWDDLGHYELLIQVLRSMSREATGIRGYTILPTTSCNARCVYCFEKGLSEKTMTRNTADKLLDYIAKTRWEDAITLKWFGGEPLCAAKTISYLCRQLEKRSIPFRSQIATNATLMTPAMVEEAKSVWHLESAQISMDGVREDYVKRKSFSHPEGTEYDRALNAVELLLDHQIQVVLRVNFDRENYPRIRSFLNEISSLYSGKQGLIINPAPLTQSLYSDPPVTVFEMREKLIQHLDELRLPRLEKEEKPFQVRLNQCMADSMGKHVVIDPEGTVFNCDSLPGPVPRGTIFNYDVPCDGANTFETVAPECRHCCFLPLCTPHYRANCPLWFEGCYELISHIEREKMRRQLVEQEKKTGYSRNHIQLNLL